MSETAKAPDKPRPDVPRIPLPNVEVVKPQPKAESSQPDPVKPPDPPKGAQESDLTRSPIVKTVTFTRRFNGRWEAVFSDGVTQLDINHLTKRMRIDFLKMKRSHRIKNRKEARQTKENTNGQ